MTFAKTASSLMAGALLMAGAAFGLNYQQSRADIGFKFRTPAGEMPAGKYDVEVRHFNSGMRYIQLNNVETRKSVVFHVLSPVENDRNENARLVFQCGAGDCSLAQVWSQNSVGYQISKPRLSAAEAERMAISVPLQSSSAAE